MTDDRDPAGARLAALFGAWRAEIDAVPLPSLVDPLRAVDVVLGAKERGRVHPPPDGARTRPPGDAREDAV